MTLTIITNNHEYELRAIDQIPMRVVFDQFDYVLDDPKDINSAHDYSQRFFKYRGWWYDVSEFVRIEFERTNSFTTVVDKDSPLARWDGVQSDSYFSGIVVKYTDDFEAVKVGRYSE